MTLGNSCFTKILTLVFLTFFLGCSSENNLNILKGEAFGTFYEIKYFGNPLSSKDIKNSIESKIIFYEECCSTYNPESYISRKQDLSTLIDDKDPLNMMALRVKVIQDLSENINTITKGFIIFDNYDHFNAIAKGYAVDDFSKTLDKYKIDNYFINVGGEIKVKGSKLDIPWTLGIEMPDENSRKIYQKLIINKNLSFATSGNYRKSGHIKNREGNPVTTNLLSVTVAIEASDLSTAYADGLATGLFAAEFPGSWFSIAEENNIAAFFIFEDNGKFKSSQTSSWLKLLE